jgi:hypothetical protein
MKHASATAASLTHPNGTAWGFSDGPLITIRAVAIAASSLLSWMTRPVNASIEGVSSSNNTLPASVRLEVNPHSPAVTSEHGEIRRQGDRDAWFRSSNGHRSIMNKP